MIVSVIIVNYNTFALTSGCIRSVLAYTRDVTYEIILVDNASTEKDASLFLVEFPHIKLIRSNKRGGFAYRHNIGIRQASEEYILLVTRHTLRRGHPSTTRANH